MKFNSIKFISSALLVATLTGCKATHMSEGPDFADIGSVPKYEGNGPKVALDFNSSLFEEALVNSGYFSDVKSGIDTRSGTTFKVRYGYRRNVTGSTSAIAVGMLWTASIIPFIIPHTESFTIEILDRNGQVLKKDNYVFKQKTMYSLWPHVLVLGTSENRVTKNQYAIMTSDIIKNMNDLGLMVQSADSRY